jgi:3-hydroxyisobutyrate dehydrogenase-like beta-hydroxyacid dehydrogenase
VTLRIAVLGLGEAGSEIARDLVAAGADVRGNDPKALSVDGVQSRGSEAEAVADAELVLSVNSSHDAMTALENALPALAPGTLWADLNTASPGLKTALAERAAERDVPVVDVALMSPVPGQGLRTPLLVAGEAADRFVEMLAPLGADVEVLPGPVGTAISRKLLRSVFYKGLAAAVVEALRGAEAAGCADWLRGNIADELAGFDAGTVDRLVDGSRTHARRRADEMDAATEQLQELGVPARIAAAARDVLVELRDVELRDVELRDAESTGLTAVAEVATDAPERYAKQLVSHLGRRLTWETDGDTSRATIGAGVGTVVVGQGVLTLRADAPDAETLERIQHVLGSHLERFGQRNELIVTWGGTQP